jgi:hypothetical protein
VGAAVAKEAEVAAEVEAEVAAELEVEVEAAEVEVEPVEAGASQVEVAPEVEHRPSSPARSSRPPEAPVREVAFP